MLQNPNTYEPFAPEEVGRERRLVVGKHSGRHLLSSLLEQHGMNLSTEETQSVLNAVRQESVEKKRSLTTQELLHLAQAQQLSHVK